MVKIATEGNAAKLIDFSEKARIGLIEKAKNFRIYMFNPDNALVMIAPKIVSQTFFNTFIPLTSVSSLDEKEKIKGMKELAGSAKKIYKRRSDGDLELIDIFTIYLFTGNHLIALVEVDSTAAVEISLALAHQNIYDCLKDHAELNRVLSEVFDELETEGY
jgi:hypothetical protein